MNSLQLIINSSLSKKIDVVLVFFLITTYLLIKFFIKIDLIGHWESVSIYEMLEPGSHYPFFNIQIRGDTTGGAGLGYPLIILSKYFSKFFTLSYSSIKYLYLIYTSIFICFYYLFIKNLLGRSVSLTSSLILFLNPYFISFSTFISAQQISLTLIFIFLFLIFKFKKNNSTFVFISTSLITSLILMNYIYARYLLILILIYIFFEVITEQKLSKKKILETLLKFFKLILLSIFLLIIFFPPNIFIIFSQKLFIPITSGEISEFNLDIFKVLFLNFKYFLNVFFLSPENNINFNIINGEKIKIFNYYSLPLFFIGFFLSLLDKKLLIINLISFFLIILICLSHSVIINNNVSSTAISVYRIYLLVPFLSVYLAYGIYKVTEFLFHSTNKKALFNVFLLTSIFLINIYYLNNGYKNFENIEKKNIKDDYHFTLEKISNKIYQKLDYDSYKNNDLKYIYIKKDIDLNFNNLPPRINNFEATKYQLHIFNTLYLNDIGEMKFSFIFKKKDEFSLYKKIYEFIKKKDDFIYESIKKKIIIFLNSFDIYNSNIDEEFVLYNISYFKMPNCVLIYSQEEYDYVKYKLKNNVTTILLSEIIN